MHRYRMPTIELILSKVHSYIYLSVYLSVYTRVYRHRRFIYKGNTSLHA